MRGLYESLYIVNSFHCMNLNTEEIITCDEQGFISCDVGTTIVFPNPVRTDDKAVETSTLIFTTKGTPLKVQINDNTMYPLYIPANTTKGFDYLRVQYFTVLEGGSQFYVEGLSSET